MQGAEVGARVVAKAYPEEKVGVFAVRGGGEGEERGGALTVLEYSEMDPEVATSPDSNRPGRLLYNW